MNTGLYETHRPMPLSRMDNGYNNGRSVKFNFHSYRLPEVQPLCQVRIDAFNMQNNHNIDNE